MNNRYSLLLGLALITGGVFVYGACSSDDAVTENNGTDAGNTSSSGNSSTGGPVVQLPDAGTLADGAAADCYTNPVGYFQIINACTDADKVTRNPVLPYLYPDGGFPPLQ